MSTGGISSWCRNPSNVVNDGREQLAPNAPAHGVQLTRIGSCGGKVGSIHRPAPMMVLDEDVTEPVNWDRHVNLQVGVSPLEYTWTRSIEKVPCCVLLSLDVRLNGQ